MAYASDPRMLVLHGLRLKGFAEGAVVVEVTGLDATEVDAPLPKLQGEQLVTRREGRISGWLLTPAGQEHHAELVAAEVAESGCDVWMERYQDLMTTLGRQLGAADGA